ncbi:hypothetical protein OFN97_03110 [Campylobacter sp. VBCF_05 NA6]|uniref:hypothetical protein n=1 Tax=unclassified Campylobacter TaxID=2593542 RepID=UPI0022E9B5CE|nr:MULTISPECIES: hypothetical protein [unclassified Campylobacter]MDA3057423.1 hypothetical protein [Campylobacter sp. VBCF_04 NA7]MDA3059005.1 hypothetical protein [Campylobacter sp. VBCF_05 NA6]
MVKIVFALAFCLGLAFCASPSEILARYDINATDDLSDKNGFADLTKISKILEKNQILNFTPSDRARGIEIKFLTKQNSKFLLKPLNLVFDRLNLENYKNLAFLNLDEGEKLRSILLRTNRMVDPGAIYTELKKHKIYVEDFMILGDVMLFRLNFESMNLLTNKEQNELKSSYFINIANTKKAVVKTKGAQVWYPNIAFYDKNLDEISNKISEAKVKELEIKFPPNAHYMHLCDAFAGENIKQGLEIKLIGG